MLMVGGFHAHRRRCRILGGLAFCLGLFLVSVAGAELFTDRPHAHPARSTVGTHDEDGPQVGRRVRGVTPWARCSPSHCFSLGIPLHAGGFGGRARLCRRTLQGLARPC
ncbi:MAG: hypothetical protein ACLT5H_10115 [Collinsella stercoris]|uniref:hypothetical protein n=1 Tax=Collinsella stercoris TaxID=147206 RepID=UPI003993D8B6